MLTEGQRLFNLTLFHSLASLDRMRNNPKMAKQLASPGLDIVGAYLPPLTVIVVEGPDAATWLQGQQSNDISQLDEHHTVYSFITNTKGKILADAWICRHAERFFVAVPSERSDDLMKWFDKHLFMEEVELSAGTHVLLTVQGADADQIMPDSPWRRNSPRISSQGFDFWIPADKQREALAKIGEQLQALKGSWLEADEWELQRLRAGVPQYGKDFDDARYPQETGLTEGTVSFTKGCYAGQEVIAMLQHRGKLKRCLHRLLFPGDVKLQPGDPIQREQGSGWITSAIFDPEQSNTLALAYLPVLSAPQRQDLVHLGTHEGKIIERVHSLC